MIAFTSRTSNCLYAATDCGKSSATRSWSAPGKRSSRAAAAASMRCSSSTYSGISCREGSSRASMPTRPRRSGRRSSRSPKASSPRTTFFDGSVRSTRRIIVSGREATSSRSRSSTASLSREARELVRIDRDRVRRDERAARVEAQARARGEKRAPPALGVEADDVVGEQPGVDRGHDRSGQHRPGLGVHPRNVGEVGQRRLGPLRPDERRRDVEVVVVEEDGRARLALELLEDGVGEGPVHRHVAVLPGAAQVVARVVLELPEAVLDEPERGIGDDVVVEVVRGGLVRDEPQAVARAVAGGLLDGTLGGDGAVLVRERARDPGDVVVRDERRERRHEPAGAAPRDARPGRVAPEGERTAIGDDDQLPPGRHVAATLRQELHEAEPRPAAVRRRRRSRPRRRSTG